MSGLRVVICRVLGKICLKKKFVVKKSFPLIFLEKKYIRPLLFFKCLHLPKFVRQKSSFPVDGPGLGTPWILARS